MTPEIGRPFSPPAALAVAVSERMGSAVRRARKRRFLANAAAILAMAALVPLASFLAEALWRQGKAVALGAVFFGGLLLALGAGLRRRPFEPGKGVLARAESGRLSPLLFARGLMLFPSSLFRDMAEGLLHWLGFGGSDPASELAAWIVLALSKPHGPGPGEWVSLGGLDKSGPYSLPEDLQVALLALRLKGLIEVDSKRYPPAVRLRENTPHPMKM